VGLTGCKQHSTSKSLEDTIWFNDELHVIVNRRRYVAPFLNFHGSGNLARQQWEIVRIPVPDRPGHSMKQRELWQVEGDSGQWFSFIQGAELLIHQTSSASGIFSRQLFLFDPNTGKDVSNPFPSTPTDWCLLNRSRTACLLKEGKQAVIRDILSARTGEPKVLARPPWTEVLEWLKYGEFSAVLTEDASHLILFPYIRSPSYVVVSNFVCEVWATNGTVEKFTLPIARGEGKFVDAELVDGEALLMWRTLLPNGYEDGIELLNAQGETLHSGKVSAFTHDPLWNLQRQEVLFPYYEGSGWDGELSRTYYVWNYSSNTVLKIGSKR
jgi:hypothetical protein